MKRILTIIFIIATALTLSFCDSGSGSSNSGGGGTPPSTTLTGTAAVGAPVIGTVNVKGANGKLSLSAIRSDGTFTVDVSALVAPFVIFAEGSANGKSVRLYSTIATVGNVNVTPATTAVMAVALGDDPETVYPPEAMTTDETVIADAPSAEEIDEAKEKIAELLSTVFDVLDLDDDFDLMNGEFVADGSGFDQVLDVVDIDVSEDGEGDTAIVISDTSTGTVYYEEDVENDEVIVDDDENLGEAVEEAVSAADAIKAKIQERMNIKQKAGPNGDWDGDLTVNSEDADFVEQDVTDAFAALYSDSYFSGGRNKDDDVASEVEEMLEDDLTGVSFNVTGVTILGPVQTYSFAGGTLTVSDNSYMSDGTYTFESGSFSPTTADAKVCSATIVISQDGEDEYTATGLWYFINEGTAETPAWLNYGDQSVMDLDLETKVVRQIYYSGGVQNVIATVLGAYVEDEGNVAYDYNTMNALLIIGDGITADYTNDNSKGLLYVRTDMLDTHYSLVNVGSGAGWWGDYYTEADGFDVSAIESCEYRIVGLHYDGATTFTPVCTWVLEAEGGKPLSVTDGEITSDTMPNVTSPASLDIAELGLAATLGVGDSWTIPFEWSNPSDSFEFEYIYCYMGGTVDSSYYDFGEDFEDFEGNSYSWEPGYDDVNPLINSADIDQIGANIFFTDSQNREYEVRIQMYSE